MNTTTKPGVLAVMDRYIAADEAPIPNGDTPTVAYDLREARATVERVVGPQAVEDLAEIRAAMEKAHSVCAGIVKKGHRVGPIYSHANTAAWQLTNALERLARIAAALAAFRGDV